MASAIELVDSHAHLSEIPSAERKVRLAILNGIFRIIAVGINTSSNIQNLALARIFPETVRPAFGYHPWMIDDAEDERAFSFIESNMEKCTAIGEIGLDYKIRTDKNRQKQVFEKLLRLAAIGDKPVIVHSRYSEQRTFETVAGQGIERAVFHWYSGPVDLLEKIVTSGYYVSATPALVYSKAHRTAMEKAPLESILIETDSPVEYHGVPSEPMSLFTTLRALCEIKGISLSDGARITTENAELFFGIRPYR